MVNAFIMSDCEGSDQTRRKKFRRRRRRRKCMQMAIMLFLWLNGLVNANRHQEKLYQNWCSYQDYWPKKKKNLKLTVKFCSYECDFFFCFFFSIFFFYCVEQQFWNHHILLGLIGFQSFGRWIDVVIHLSFRRCYFTSFDLFKL